MKKSFSQRLLRSLIVSLSAGLLLVLSIPPAGATPAGATPAGATQSGGATLGRSSHTGHLAGVSGGSHTSNWLVGSDGGVFAYGEAGFYGSAGAIHLNAPIVGMASTPDGAGYWLGAKDGGVFSYGDAGFYGSAGAIHLNAPIVGAAASFDGAGYFLVASDGGVFTYGDAGFHGSAGGTNLVAPIVAMAATPDGAGYWLVASDGGVFTYGDAGFFGSASGTGLTAPIAGMAASPDGAGYWLVAADGEVFPYGDAVSYGSAQGADPSASIVSITSTVDGAGYWLVASDGNIFSYGDAGSYSSAGTIHLTAPVVGMAAQGMIIPSTTTNLDPSVVVSVSGTPSSGQTIVLSQGTVAPPVGQVLMLGVTPQTPNGFLGTVTSVTTNSDGSISVATTPASIDDTFSAGTLSFGGTLDATDVVSNTAAGSAQVLTPADLSPHRTLHPIVVSIPKGEQGFECSGGVTFTAGGSLSIVPTFNFTDQHDFLSFHPSGSATASLTTTETAEVDASVAAKADCTYTKTLSEIKFKRFEVEGIVVQPVLTLTLSGSVGVEASISAQIVQTATATIGISVSGGCNPSIDWTDLSFSPNCSVNATPIDSGSSSVTPTVAADGTVDAKAALTGELALEVEDGIVAPYISAGPELSASATADASNTDGPSASWSAEACFNGGAGVKFDIGIHVKKFFKKFDVTLYTNDFSDEKIISLCKDFGGEGGGTDQRPTPPTPPAPS